MNILQNSSFCVPLKTVSEFGLNCSFNLNHISVCCRPVPAERRVSKENKKVELDKKELDKKELKETQKRENEYRKKFKVTILSVLKLEGRMS